MPEKVSSDESLQSGYQENTTIVFQDRLNLLRHSKTIVDHLSETSGSRSAISEELEAAVRYFNFDLTVTRDHDSYSGYSDYSAIRPGNPIIESEIENVFCTPDAISIMRDLIEGMTGLSEYIRSINDPLRKTADLRAIRAYLDAYVAILDENDPTQLSETLPKAIPVGIVRRLGKIDWNGFPEHVRKWVDTVAGIIIKIVL